MSAPQIPVDYSHDHLVDREVRDGSSQGQGPATANSCSHKEVGTRSECQVMASVWQHTLKHRMQRQVHSSRPGDSLPHAGRAIAIRVCFSYRHSPFARPEISFSAKRAR